MTNLKERLAGPITTTDSVLDRLRTDRVKTEIASALPRHIDASTFLRHASTLIAQNKDLLEIASGKPGTDPQSIIRGVMRAAGLGLDLDPTLGQAWLIPRTVAGTKQAVFQVGYQGLLELTRRSGKVRRLEVERVYARDHFDARKGSNGHLEFRPDWFAPDRGDLIGWYALVELDDGITQWVTMSLREMEAHRDKYAATTPTWKKNFAEMGDKTIFLRLARWLPKSTEILEAVADDPEALAVMTVTPDDDVIDVIDDEERDEAMTEAAS